MASPAIGWNRRATMRRYTRQALSRKIGAALNLMVQAQAEYSTTRISVSGTAPKGEASRDVASLPCLPFVGVRNRRKISQIRRQAGISAVVEPRKLMLKSIRSLVALK